MQPHGTSIKHMPALQNKQQLVQQDKNHSDKTNDDLLHIKLHSGGVAITNKNQQGVIHNENVTAF